MLPHMSNGMAASLWILNIKRNEWVSRGFLQIFLHFFNCFHQRQSHVYESLTRTHIIFLHLFWRVLNEGMLFITLLSNPYTQQLFHTPSLIHILHQALAHKVHKLC